MAGLVDASRPVSLLDVGPTVLDLFEIAPISKSAAKAGLFSIEAKTGTGRRLFSIS